MFETFIGKPVFNLLTFIYGILPGHNLGLAIIVFTIVIRFLLWPLLKKQLHNAKKMRELQPDLKRIKKEAGGDRQKESQLMMELYKERGISPFSSFGTALLQLPILFALFHGISKIINDPSQIVSYSYGFVQNLPWMKELAGDITKLDTTLLGVVDLIKKPVEGGFAGMFIPSNIYIFGVIIIILSAYMQYRASKMLMMVDKDARGVRQILRDAAQGKEADQSEMNAAMSKYILYFMPAIIVLTSIHFATALGLYWLISAMVQYAQQRYILRQDQQELVATAHIGDSQPIEAEVIPPKSKTKKRKTNKRRKR